MVKGMPLTYHTRSAKRIHPFCEAYSLRSIMLLRFATSAEE
jgi:hypothetical protein